MNRGRVLWIVTVLGVMALLAWSRGALGSMIPGFVGAVFLVTIVLMNAPPHAARRKRGRHDLSFVRVRLAPRPHERAAKRNG